MSSTKTKATEAVETAAEEAKESATAKTAKTTSAKEAVAKTTVKKTEPLMYVGPTLTGIAIQNRVYTEIPEGAAAMIAEDAELGNLFIPVAKYPAANKMLREGTGYIYKAFVKALKLKK